MIDVNQIQTLLGPMASKFNYLSSYVIHAYYKQAIIHGVLWAICFIVNLILLIAALNYNPKAEEEKGHAYVTALFVVIMVFSITFCISDLVNPERYVIQSILDDALGEVK